MIDPTGWSTIGPWGLVTIFVLLIAFGFLIPRWTHKERIHDKEREITLLRASLAKRDEQVDRLIEQHDKTLRLLEDIKAAGRPAGTRTGT